MMKFEVMFRTYGQERVVDLKPPDVGIRFLDQMRVQLDDNSLTPKCVNIGHEKHYTTFELSIGEEQARQCPHFLDQQTVPVKVPIGYLNKYWDVIGRKTASYSQSLGYLVNAEWSIDGARLWTDWAAAGFPLEWGIPKNEKSDSA